MFLLQLTMYFIPCDVWFPVITGRHPVITVRQPVITGRQFFFIKNYLYPDVLFTRHVTAFLDTSDLKEVRIIFYRITLQC